MKKMMKVLMLMVLALSMVACSSEETTKETQGQEVAQEAQGQETAESSEKSRLDMIKESGKIVMGTSADYPPYEFHAIVDGKDEIVGFDIEVAKAIAEGLGVELEIQDMGFDPVLTGVQTGLIDAGIAGINPNPERAESMDFSDVYFTSKYCVLTTKDKASLITKTDDLNKLVVGVQTGSVQESMVSENLTPVSVVSLPKVTELVMQLKTNMVDAIVLEVPVADSYVKANPELETVEAADFSEYSVDGGSVVVIGKGETELQTAINEVIGKLLEEGKVDEWYAEAVKLAESQQE